MKVEIEKLRIEVESTIRFLYSVIAFHEALAHENNVAKMNQNPDFWRIFESSMLANVFIGIRRIYEAKSKTFNFQKFIEKCISNKDEFSLTKLQERKVQSGALSVEKAKSYVDDKYEPCENDFKEMARLVRTKSKNMKGVYTNVASKVYAHAIHFSHAEALNSNQDLNLYEIEEALLSVWHCYEQVWQLYENGRKPTYEVPSYPYKKEVVDCVYKQINA